MDVHVNLSPRQFADPDLVALVTDVLRTTGLAPHRLCLEITETAVVEDVGAAVDLLRRLRAVGVKVAIDDFGVGYSSLASLRHLPVDVLKLDRSFVERLGDGDAADAAIVVAVVNLARSLGLTVVGEGVETVEQRRELRALGCTTAQGYLFARPLPAGDMTALLARELWR
jgi:EAL domain-containing protein (putative c-di-GMP-specific phosphodiesterase class I)